MSPPIAELMLQCPKELKSDRYSTLLQGVKLKAAQSANTELETQVEFLEAKEGMLQTQLLRKDFDLAHTQALKAILDEKTNFLERTLAELDVTAQDRVSDEALH